MGHLASLDSLSMSDLAIMRQFKLFLWFYLVYRGCETFTR